MNAASFLLLAGSIGQPAPASPTTVVMYIVDGDIQSTIQMKVWYNNGFRRVPVINDFVPEFEERTGCDGVRYVTLDYRKKIPLAKVTAKPIAVIKEESEMMPPEPVKIPKATPIPTPEVKKDDLPPGMRRPSEIDDLPLPKRIPR